MNGMEFKGEEFFELSKELFCIIGTDGYLKKVNNSFLNAVGYSCEELLSKPVSDFLVVNEQQDVAGIQSNWSDQLSTNSEIRFRCGDGTCRWFSWSGTKLSDQPYIYASLRDVSNQRSLEEQLRKALDFNQQILDSSVDIICTIDVNEKFVSINRASITLLGYTQEEMIGRPYKDFIYPEDLKLAPPVVKHLKSGSMVTNFENRYICKDGTVVPLVWSAVWSEDKTMFYCIGRNGTDKKRQEAEIVQGEKRFRALVQAGSDLIAVIDLEGRYRYLSPTVTTVLGFDPQSLIGRPVFENIHPDYHELISSAILKVSQQYKVELPLYKFKNSEGEWRWIKTVATNLINDSSVKGIVVNSRDVTESVFVEQQKEKAIKRLKNLLENYTQGYLSIDKNWIVREVNPATLRLLGIQEATILNKSIAELFPRSEGTVFYRYYEQALKENILVEFEEPMISANRWFHISAYPYDGELTVFFKEITEEKLQRSLVNLEKEVLEINVKAQASLKETADRYLEGITRIYRLRGLLSLYNKDKSLLLPFSAPTLPSGYFQSLSHGFPPSKDFGSCGAAAYYMDYQIVRDIAAHPEYEEHRELLLSSGLKSCWSIPLINAKNKLTGILTVYNENVQVPDDKERELIKRVASFLQVIVESQQIKERLLLSNERYKYITSATNDATYDWNMESQIIYWGEGEVKLFGYKGQKSTITDWENRVHPADRERVNASLEQALNDPQTNFWHEEYRYQRADQSYAFVIEDGYILRDALDKPVRMVGALKDISKLKQSANQILKQNRRLREIATINSHHIRKPLANVLGIISALQYADSEQVSELLSMLDESGQELDKIIRKIAKKTLIGE